MVELKVLRTNEGMALILTEELASRLGLGLGDALRLEENEGTFTIRHAGPESDQELDAVMAEMEDILARFPRTFEILSK